MSTHLFTLMFSFICYLYNTSLSLDFCASWSPVCFHSNSDLLFLLTPFHSSLLLLHETIVTHLLCMVIYEYAPISIHRVSSVFNHSPVSWLFGICFSTIHFSWILFPPPVWQFTLETNFNVNFPNMYDEKCMVQNKWSNWILCFHLIECSHMARVG